MVKKVEIKPRAFVCVSPTVLVGVMVDGRPNFITVGLCGAVNATPPMISVSIRPHRYSMKGINQCREFSVNIPSVKQVKETNYCGVVSGANADKTKQCGFNVFYGHLKNAPLIEQCPVNMECKVEHILELGSHLLIVGRVEGTHVSKKCLTDGHPDVTKIQPLIFVTPPPMQYYALGLPAGQAPEPPKSS